MSSRVQRGIAATAQPVVWRKAEKGGVDSLTTAGPADGTATHEAQRLQLEVELEQRCRQAQAQGRKEGEAAAQARAEAKIEELASRLARSIEEITGVRQRLRHEAEQQIVALSLAVARRILHRELTVEPEAVTGLLKAALERLDIRELHRIRVHPDTAPLLERHLEKIGLPRKVELIADPALERGALILESDSGSLDASVETQLAEIERGFADLVRRT
jgi:flagellar assembly protein FliH